MEKYVQKFLKRQEKIQKERDRTAKIWERYLLCPYQKKRRRLYRKLEFQILKTSKLMQRYGVFEPDWFVKVYFSVIAD